LNSVTLSEKATFDGLTVVGLVTAAEVLVVVAVVGGALVVVTGGCACVVVLVLVLVVGGCISLAVVAIGWSGAAVVVDVAVPGAGAWAVVLEWCGRLVRLGAGLVGLTLAVVDVADDPDAESG
jgi:hypothetical protein